MPNVIDTLVVVLGLDASRFTQQQREAVDAFRKSQEVATQSGKDIEAQGKKVDEFFASMKRGALGLGALFFGGRGVKEFVGYITTMDAGLARTSRTLGESAKELAAWQNVARQAGGSTESITSAFHGLTQEMNLFMLGRGGESALLPVLTSLGLGINDEAGKLKTASRLFLEISEALQKAGTDIPRNAAMLSLVPGMNQETINLLLKGRGEMEKMLAAERATSTVSKESAVAAEQLASAWSRMEQAAERLGRTLINKLNPALQAWVGFGTYILDKFGNLLFDTPMRPPDKPGKPGAPTAAPVPVPASPIANTYNSPKEREAYIREAARKRGIDPDVAVRVARSEGLGGNYAGDENSSFGDFQLHYGGVSARHRAPGLGDEFTRRTGLDARDPKTWKEQTDFALDEARKSGWGPWHGWKGYPMAGIGPAPAAPEAKTKPVPGTPEPAPEAKAKTPETQVPAAPEGRAAPGALQSLTALPGFTGMKVEAPPWPVAAAAGAPAAASVDNSRTQGDTTTTTNTTTIGKVEVHTAATDAEGIARDIGPAMQRSGMAASANNALQ